MNRAKDQSGTTGCLKDSMSSSIDGLQYQELEDVRCLMVLGVSFYTEQMFTMRRQELEMGDGSSFSKKVTFNADF